MAIAEVGSGSQRTAIQASNVDSAASVSLTVTAGNLLIVAGAVWQTGSGITACPITDTRSTSYTTLLGPAVSDGAGGTFTSFIAYGVVPSSGGCVVTVNPSGTGCYINAVVDEFAGTNASTPLDVDGGASTSATSPISDGLTTGTAGALIIAVLAANASATLNPPAGYTQMQEDQTGAIAPYNAAFLIAGAAGPYTAEFTASAGTAFSVQTAAFQVAGAPPPSGDFDLLVLGRPLDEARA